MFVLALSLRVPLIIAETRHLILFTIGSISNISTVGTRRPFSPMSPESLSSSSKTDPSRKSTETRNHPRPRGTNRKGDRLMTSEPARVGCMAPKHGLIPSRHALWTALIRVFEPVSVQHVITNTRRLDASNYRASSVTAVCGPFADWKEQHKPIARSDYLLSPITRRKPTLHYTYRLQQLKLTLSHAWDPVDKQRVIATISGFIQRDGCVKAHTWHLSHSPSQRDLLGS